MRVTWTSPAGSRCATAVPRSWVVVGGGAFQGVHQQQQQQQKCCFQRLALVAGSRPFVWRGVGCVANLRDEIF